MKFTLRWANDKNYICWLEIIEEMKEAGFELTKEFDFLLPVQYYLAFKRVS